MARRQVFVYRGEGVNLFSYREVLGSLIEALGKHYVVNVIDGARLRSGDWVQDAALLAIPGGRDIPYDAVLRGEANAHIRRFVEGGGSFLGLCAGAYYGASEVCFGKGTPLEVVGTRELAFYPGAAVGPLYLPSAFSYDSEVGSRAAAVAFADRYFCAYYNGGCTFESPERYSDQVTIMGQYTDVGPGQTHLPAAIACQVGQGVAVLSGVHIEYRLRSLDKSRLPAGVYDQLAATEAVRHELFGEVARYLVGRSL